jgi:hypothetical protein
MVIVLALGIGANTAVLTIVDQTIFRPVLFRNTAPSDHRWTDLHDRGPKRSHRQSVAG